MNHFNQQQNPFLFTIHEVRTATDDKGEVWFCAIDVFKAMDITWKGSYSLRNYPQEWVCPLHLRGQSGSGEVVFIAEPAVYRVLFRSNKPEAVEFANWVCSEVLPTLRKQGYFGLSKDLDQIKATNAMVSLLRSLNGTADAFTFQLLSRRLRNLCNAMGEPMPSLDLVGKDRRQLALEM
tara:strand:+ start:2533 stop:3069 length:537 start_codon:yes stop_codon:yes gene_type:complete